jgi:muramidase (phage lysozyme)
MATKKSRLAEIYKSEKARGGGIASTLGKRALEKIDPRQFFNQSGFLATVLPSLFKAYSATGGTDTSKITMTPTKESMVTEAMNVRMNDLASRMNDVAVNTQLSAKNSLVLPAMARDMNLMRQNIAKLAKAQGVKPTYKADMFFKGASEREKEYESKFGKAKATMPTASPTTKPEEKGGLSGILGFLAPLFAPLLKIGSTIVGAITSTLSGLGEFLLKGITSIFSVDNLMKALGLTGSVLKGLIKMVGMIVTNPIFLAIAAAGSLFALAKMLREEFDEKKQRYMELATKKKEQGALSPEEEAELQKLNSTKLQQAAREELGGYDPILNKVTKTTRVQGIVAETAAAGASLRDEAAIQLRDEYEQAGKNPNLITNEEIAKRADQLKQLRTPVPDDGSFAAAEARRFRQTEGSEGRMARLGVSPSPVEGGRGTINPPNVSPTPVSGVLDLIASGEAISKDPYNSMNQGTPGGKISGSGVSTNIIGQNLTDMTIGEILSRAPNANDNAEERKQKGAVFAAGRYQIIPKTLQGLVDQGVVSKDEKFTPEVQDRLALKLVEQSGATKSINEGDLEKAQYQLSKVWASLPVPAGMMLKSGQVSTGVESFYGGANKAKEGLTLASLQLPSATPTMTVASARPATGPIVTAATAELEKERIQLASAPIVVTAPSVNVQQSQPNKMPQSINQPSVVDSEFMKLLVGRTVTI